MIHPDADAVAGHAGLGDLEQRRADPILVADAHLVVGEPLDRKVLAELAVDEVPPVQLLLPVAIGSELVDEHGALLTAMAGNVTLPIALDIEPRHAATPVDRSLPDPRAYGPAPPKDVLWQSDVHGDQAALRAHRHDLPPMLATAATGDADRPLQPRMKASRSALIGSASTVHMPCGKPG